MKLRNLISKAKALPKKALIALSVIAVTLPAVAGLATADTQVLMEGDVKAINVTAGETVYKDPTSAMVDDIVQVQLWQHNREMPDTTFANNNRVKFSVPSAQGKTQVITGTSSADNANTVTDSTTVNLSMDRARVEFIPGSAMFRYNKGAVDGRADCITGLNYPPADCFANKAVPDSVVTDPNGVNLDTLRGTPLKGCNAFHETVTIQVRVKADVVSINKYVRHAGQGPDDWTTSTNAKPGEDLEYMIKFKNEGNTQLNHVAVADNLPKYHKYVAGTTKLKNGANPNGINISSNNVTTGGIDVGSYMPGAVGYVWFTVKLAPLEGYEKCNLTYDLRNVGIVKPEGMNEFYNTAQVLVNVPCKNQPPQPTYSCNSLKADLGANRFAQLTTAATATNGATITRYIYNFGDGTQEFTTTDNVAKHTYTKDGSFTASVKVEVRLPNGTLATASGPQCTAPVKFEAGKPPVVTTPTTTLPNTGAGSVAAIFATVVVVSTLGYYVVITRFGRSL